MMRKGGLLVIVGAAVLGILAGTAAPLCAGGPEESGPLKIDPANLGLTPAEKKWLQSRTSITIAGPKSFPPFHYYDTDGQLRGIAADYILTIMDQLGIRVAVLANLPWPRVLEMAKQGEIDLIPCAAKSGDRESYLGFSTPYLSFPLVILSRKDAPFIGGIEDLHGKKVTVVKNNVITDWLERDGITYEPYLAASPLEGLKTVSMGAADAAIENMAAASYLIQEYGLTNLKIAAPTPYGNYDLHMAVRKDLPELLGIINKVFRRISPEQHMQIRNKWLSVRYEYGISKGDIMKWVLAALMFSGSILAVVLIWNRKLNREIRDRNLAEQALGESEERFREMADLLPGAIVEMDRDLKLTYVNQHGLTLFGLKPEDITPGINGLTFIHPDDRDTVMARVADQVAGKKMLSVEYRLKDRERKNVWILLSSSSIQKDGEVTGFRTVVIDITNRKQIESEREELIKELQNALNEIKVLQGFLPICAGCKKIRDDEGYWQQIDEYIQERTDTRFSHGICPDCAEKLYPGFKYPEK